MNIADGFMFWIGRILAELAYVGAVLIIVAVCALVGGWMSLRRQCRDPHPHFANVECSLKRGHTGGHWSFGEYSGQHSWGKE